MVTFCFDVFCCSFIWVGILNFIVSIPVPYIFIFEPPRGKTNNVVSEQVQHKLTCTVAEKSYRLEFLDLESRGIVLSV